MSPNFIAIKFKQLENSLDSVHNLPFGFGPAPKLGSWPSAGARHLFLFVFNIEIFATNTLFRNLTHIKINMIYICMQLSQLHYFQGDVHVKLGEKTFKGNSYMYLH